MPALYFKALNVNGAHGYQSWVMSLKLPHQKGKRGFPFLAPAEKQNKNYPPPPSAPTTPAQHSQGRNPVGLVSHEVICGPRPLHIDMAYYDWLDFNWVPSPEFTEVDISLGEVIEKLSLYSELCIPTGLCLNCKSHFLICLG